MALLERIIRAHGGEAGRGLPIGALTSQHFANHYLGSLDRLVKEGLRIRGYVRYMDDALIWGQSARELTAVLGGVEAHLRDRLGLVLKPTRFINRVGHGVDFLGARVFPGRLTLNRRSRVRFRRGLLGLEAAFERGEIDEADLQGRATALVAFTRMAGASGWRWRRHVLGSSPVSGHRPRAG